MNYIDMFILVLIVYAIFRGLVRGLVMQLASLAALVVGIYAALKLSGFVSRQLAQITTMDFEYLYMVSLFITFMVAFFLINILGRIFEKMVETARLSIINKLIGACFSLCKVMLIVGILLLYMERFDKQIPLLPKGDCDRSLLYRPVTSLARLLFPSLASPRFHHDPDEEFV
jgi:membrane protein required for colicin V production